MTYYRCLKFHSPEKLKPVQLDGSFPVTEWKTFKQRKSDKTTKTNENKIYFRFRGPRSIQQIARESAASFSGRCKSELMWFMVKVNETNTPHANQITALNQVYVWFQRLPLCWSARLVLSDAEFTLLSGNLWFLETCFVWFGACASVSVVNFIRISPLSETY